MTEIIYKRGKKPADNPDPFPAKDETLKASLGDVLRKKIVVDSGRGIVKRTNERRI